MKDQKTELYQDGVKSVLFTVTANNLNMRNPVFQLKMGEIVVSTQPELAPGGSRVFGSVTLPYHGERKVYLDAIGRNGKVIGKHEFDLSRIPNVYSYFEGTVDLSKRGKMLGTLDIRIDFSRKRVTKVVDRTGIFALCTGAGTVVFERDVKQKGTCCNAVVSADSAEDNNRRKIFLNQSSSSTGDVRTRARAMARGPAGSPAGRPVAHRSSSSSTIVEGTTTRIGEYQPLYGRGLDSLSSESLKKKSSSSSSSTEYVQPVHKEISEPVLLAAREAPEIIMMDLENKDSLSPRHKLKKKSSSSSSSSSSSKSSCSSAHLQKSMVPPKRKKSAVSAPTSPSPAPSKVRCAPKMKAFCSPKKKDGKANLASPGKADKSSNSDKSTKSTKRKRSGRKVPATPSKLLRKMSSCSSIGKDKASPLKKLSASFTKKKSSSSSDSDDKTKKKLVSPAIPSSVISKQKRRRSSISSCGSSRKASTPVKPSTGKLMRSCSNSSKFSDGFKGIFKKPKAKKSSSSLSQEKYVEFNKPKTPIVLLHKKKSSSSSSSAKGNKVIQTTTVAEEVMNQRKSSSSSSIRPKPFVIPMPVAASPEPAPVADRLMSLTESTVSKRKRRSKQQPNTLDPKQRRPSMVSCASSKSGSRLSCGGGRKRKSKVISRSTSNLSDLSDIFPKKGKKK